MMKSLETICSYRNEKASAASIKAEDIYISTENMGPNRGGVLRAVSAPSEGKVSRFHKGDTLVSNIRPYFKKIWNADCNGYCSNDMLVFQPDQRCSADYLYWLLCDDAFFDYVMATSKGTKMPRGDKSAIMSYAIPSNSEMAQRNITSILNPIQAKIEANTKLNGYLAELAQTLYNDWFRDFGHWDGRMPSHWESGVLGDYVTVKRGGSPRPIQEYLSNEGLRWLKIADVSSINGPYILEIKEHIKEEGLRRTVYLEPGSLVLSNSATPGIPKILSIGTCIHDGWLYFPQSEFTNEWLYCYFLNVRQELVRMANGSVFQNLKTDIVKNFEVIRPDDETLASFQKTIAPLFGLMETRQQESKQLAELRDALLPKLMSGEIDVTRIDLTQLNSHLAERLFQS